MKHLTKALTLAIGLALLLASYPASALAAGQLHDPAGRFAKTCDSYASSLGMPYEACTYNVQPALRFWTFNDNGPQLAIEKNTRTRNALCLDSGWIITSYCVGTRYDFANAGYSIATDNGVVFRVFPMLGDPTWNVAFPEYDPATGWHTPYEQTSSPPLTLADPLASAPVSAPA